jgi:low molecular weight protein-tyrosine phosphatase
MHDRTSILFVCLGNICRSPLAEGVFRHLVAERNLADRFEIDSAGTGGWHVGSPPDERSLRVASAHGVSLNGEARQVQPEDFRRFDMIVAMDSENLRDLGELAARSGGAARLHLLRDFDPQPDGPDVPDPYYGGPSVFEDTYVMIHRSCERLLQRLTSAEAAEAG